MFLNTIILMLCLLIDTTTRLSVGSLILRLHLATLFLLFLGFRRPFYEVMLMLVVFVVLSHPFTGAGFANVFFSYGLVLFLTYRLRSKTYTEAYLTLAFWTLLITQGLDVVMQFGVFGRSAITTWLGRFPERLCNGFILALLTVPLFILWDRLYDRRTHRPHEALDLFG